MGKAKRNREKRRRAAAEELSDDLVERLAAVESLDDLAALLDEFPQLQTGLAGRRLQEFAQVPGMGASIRPHADLVRGVRDDPEAAWARFEIDRAASTAVSDRLAETVEIVEAAAAAGDHDTVVALAAPAVEEAEAAGLILMSGFLRLQEALALLRRSSPDRAADLEQARATLEAALEYSEPGEQRATLLGHLGLVFIERVRGDRGENGQTAAQLLRAALSEIPRGGDADLVALFQTNLAMCLIRGEAADRRAQLEEAVQLCRDALSHRSPERDAVDWAYTQVNLGEALTLLFELDAASSEDALAPYEAVVGEADRLDPWLVGAARRSAGRFRLRRAGADSAALEDGEQPAPGEEERIAAEYERAHDELLEAERLLKDAPDPLQRGHVLDDLAEVAQRRGLVDEAIAWGLQALAILRPTASPPSAITVGWRLGGALAEQGRWSESAAAFRDAVEAAELSFHGRLADAARAQQIERAGNLNRWAAFVVARDGDALAAALILENGRARELRRRLGLGGLDDQQLADVPTELVAEMQQSMRELRAAALGSASGDAAYRFQSAVSAIRSLPGHETFATGASAEDLAGAVEDGWPLVYIDPTPYGTALLLLQRDGGGLAASAHFLPVLAMDVFGQLAFGLTEAELAEAIRQGLDPRGSYMLAIGGEGDPDQFQDNLATPLPWLGETIAKPIARLLGEPGFRS